MRLLNLKKIKSLQVRIMVVILIFLFIPVSILLNYNFSHTESVLQEKTSSLILGNLEQIGNKVENTTQDIMRISSIIGSDNLILSHLSKTDIRRVTDFEYKDLHNLTVSELIKLTDIEREITNIKSNFFNYNTHAIIFGSDGITYSSLGNVSDEFGFKLNYQKVYKSQNWYRKLESGKEIGIWVAPFYYDTPGFGSEQKYISLARVIKNNYTQTIQGIVMVNFSEDNFVKSLGSNVNGIVTLLNGEREVIFSSDRDNGQSQSFQKDLYAKIPDGGKGSLSANIGNKEYLINYYSLDKMGWSLVSILPYSEVTQEITNLRWKTYAINFLIFGVFLILSILSIMYLLYPLKKLIAKIRRTKIGEYRIGSKEPDNIDDVSDIVNSFDYMFKRVEELANTVIREQKYENDLKYEALRAQINPHFLFNTLNTIKWTALISGSENVSKMISSLGKLLEVSMNKGEDEIPFKEEIELVESYVYIQNIRFNDVFKLVFNIDDGICDLLVLKLILQPIVENAIIHGLKNKVGTGEIVITAGVIDGRLSISVKDNGVGISKERIEEILQTDSENRHQKYSSIGLMNIHERLKIKYGNEYGLTIDSVEGSGTTVSILLPVLARTRTEGLNC